jgi:hypothetical protein
LWTRKFSNCWHSYFSWRWNQLQILLSSFMNIVI